MNTCPKCRAPLQYAISDWKFFDCASQTNFTRGLQESLTCLERQLDRLAAENDALKSRFALLDEAIGAATPDEALQNIRRITDRLAELKREVDELRRNQCGEQVGWWSVHGGLAELKYPHHESWKPEPIFRRAK